MRQTKTIFVASGILRGIVFVMSVFIVLLGMRNPYLNNPNGPKQRPRAVIEDLSKCPKEESANPDADTLALLPAVSLPAPRSFRPAASAWRFVPFPDTISPYLVARAPPFVSLSCC